jgi:predicted dehydrogenase
VGFRALFERAAFAHLAVFEDGPPRSTFTIVSGEASAQPVSVPGRNPYQAELQRFVDCINGRADPGLLDAERAIEALVLSAATQRALAEGRSIEID